MSIPKEGGDRAIASPPPEIVESEIKVFFFFSFFLHKFIYIVSYSRLAVLVSLILVHTDITAYLKREKGADGIRVPFYINCNNF